MGEARRLVHKDFVQVDGRTAEPSEEVEETADVRLGKKPDNETSFSCAKCNKVFPIEQRTNEDGVLECGKCNPF
jgi:hypothetical protein